MVVTGGSRIPAGKAAEVCRQFSLSEAGSQLLGQEHTPEQYLAVLEQYRLYDIALEFLAHALPKREAIWWATLCVEFVGGPDAPSPARAAVNTAVQWVLSPREQTRRTGYATAQAAGILTPQGALAMAVYWSGGNMAPPDSVTTVAPSPLLCAQTVARAVFSAAVAERGKHLTRNARQFLRLGLAVAAGRHLWDIHRG